jgi:putative ABC transport system permease protein
MASVCGPGVLCLIGIGSPQPCVLAQGVEAGSQTPSGATTPKPSVSAYIELRSVLRDDAARSADEKPAAPRAGAQGNPEPANPEKAGRKKPQQVVSYGLKYADYDRIMETNPGIREAVAIREIPKQIRYRSHAIDGRVVGTTASYGKVNPLEVERGRFLTDDDHARFQNRAVIGSEIARTLFPDEDPIDKALKAGTDYYTVVGVVKERANTSVISGRFEAHDLNKDVYISLSTCRVRFGERIIIVRAGQSPRAEETQLSRLTLRLRDEANVEETAAGMRAVLKPFHPKDDVEVIVVKIQGKAR